jgi:hypothetical protein
MFRPSLQRFRTVRVRTLCLVGDLTQAQSDWLPAPDKWSVGEVLDHLLLAEKYLRQEIRQLIDLKKARRTATLRRGFAELDISLGFIPKSLLPFLEIPFAVVNLFVPSAVRGFLVRSRLIPAQHPTVATPRKARSASELRTELGASFRETEALFEANPSLDYRQMFYVHPLLGSNDVLELLHIVTLHEERHQEQIADVLQAMRGWQAATALAERKRAGTVFGGLAPRVRSSAS